MRRRLANNLPAVTIECAVHGEIGAEKLVKNPLRLERIYHALIPDELHPPTTHTHTHTQTQTHTANRFSRVPKMSYVQRTMMLSKSPV
jgi:hypothetical protein